MKDQEIFDTVVKGLRLQGKGSFVESKEGGPTCKYRGPDGTKCAAGLLILPDEYQSWMDTGLSSDDNSGLGYLFDQVLDEAQTRVPSLFKRLNSHRRLIGDLQRVHDSACRDEDFLASCEEEWERIALEFDLTMPVKE